MSREQEIFSGALERTSEVSRSAYLQAACAGQPEMRARIEALLRAAESAGGFLGEEAAAAPEEAGVRIGRYRLREQIGEGGFGIVYVAEQEQPVRRTVALKIIKLGMDTRAVVARFEAERQALAMMDHPNIARVLDGGATEGGRPYFVMEYVRGVPITTFCDQRALGVRDRLELFVQVCRAVHHAHQKGIIHRDLKPSNILITTDVDQPQAKVIDFGIAKATREPLTEHALLTRLHLFVGTPAYMSPEQVGLGDIDVDTRSDIYSLGALLYEVLAGVPVLDSQALLAAGYAEVQRTIHHVEPALPSQRVAALAAEEKQRVAHDRGCGPPRLIASLRGDLDRVVAKCLEKDRTRRYETTDDLAQDILRHLNDEPVHARSATVAYRAVKFVRRHRHGVAAAAVALALVIASSGYHTHRLAVARDRAQAEARKAAKVGELLTELLTAGDPFRSPAPGGAGANGILDAGLARARTEFAQQPDVQVQIFNAIGRVFLRRGEHDKALPILNEALAAGRMLDRPGAPTAQTLCDLGVLWRERCDYERAVTLINEALELRRRLLGNENNEVAITLVELGRAYFQLERVEQAEPVFREALAIRRRVLGDAHRETATSFGDVGLALWQKGDLAGAEPHLMQSLAVHRRALGPDHPNVAQAMANVALLKFEEKELAAAETLWRGAIDIMRRAMGERHWRVARLLLHVGAVAREQGRIAEAALVLDDARQMVAVSLGTEHSLMATLEVERARVHLAAGQPAEAEALLRHALTVHGRIHGDTSWRIATLRSLLGAALMDLGRGAEAKSMLVAAAAVLPDVPGPRGRETQANRERLAAVERSRVAH